MPKSANWLTTLHDTVVCSRFADAGAKDTRRRSGERHTTVSNDTEGLRPGNKATRSGQYEEVGPRGGKTGHEVTGVKGKTLPPTQKPGDSYKLVDPTKNKSGS